MTDEIREKLEEYVIREVKLKSLKVFIKPDYIFFVALDPSVVLTQDFINGINKIRKILYVNSGFHYVNKPLVYTAFCFSPKGIKHSYPELDHLTIDYYDKININRKKDPIVKKIANKINKFIRKIEQEWYDGWEYLPKEAEDSFDRIYSGIEKMQLKIKKLEKKLKQQNNG